MNNYHDIEQLTKFRREDMMREAARNRLLKQIRREERDRANVGKVERRQTHGVVRRVLAALAVAF